MESKKTVGEIIDELYNLWQVHSTNWPNDNNPSHLEFELRGFNPNSNEQIQLVAELCYIVQSGAWETSYSALKKMLPDQDFEFTTLGEIKNYFSGRDYSSDEETLREFIKNQRNPFILELISHVMLKSIENKEALDPFSLSLQGIHYMHLSSKKQGLDLAAIAKDNSNEQYYLVIGESKNRKSPSEGTAEALGAFKEYDSGKKWPDIRQVMRTVANSFESVEGQLSASISKHILWKQKVIYRLTIEHRSKRPKKGSQFREFGNSTPNVRHTKFRQCEAISTKRLDDFYESVSQKVVSFIESKERELNSYA
ncbi:hypothetical protein ACFFIS_05960 [Virgibacillus soli]